MSVFSRLSDIINSNLTSILDKAENPEKIMRLMIQEMEETLVEVRSDAARIIADRKEAQRTLDRLIEAQAEWQRKAELAISKDREDLAKGALLEKAKLEETGNYLREDLGNLNAALVKHEEDITKLEAKLREAKAKQKTVKAREETATSQLKVRRQIYDSRIDDTMARFEKMENRIDRVEGEVESFDLGKSKSLSEEIAELEAESAIEDELAALKAKVAGGKSDGKPAATPAEE
jgi:phage shock protein A